MENSKHSPFFCVDRSKRKPEEKREENADPGMFKLHSNYKSANCDLNFCLVCGNLISTNILSQMVKLSLSDVPES